MPIAQLNIAKPIAPIDSPALKDFVANIDRINQLAEVSDGFIWRLTGDDNFDHAATVMGNPNLLINMSVWQNIESLKNYVYQSAHKDIMRRKKEWFTKMVDMHMVLWEIELNHIPSIEEAKERLTFLQEHGESEFAFTFKRLRA